jgi:transcriptional regulator with XRE-family HTH domain
MTVDDWDGSLAAVAARLRHANGLTQEQLAERSGLSVRAISSIECGSRHPRRFTVERLGIGLGLSADERISLIDLANRTRTASAVGPTSLSTNRLSVVRREVPLIGRAPELAAVRELLWGREPGLLVLSGEPGVGKTRLLAEASRIAAAGGLPVLSGHCRRGADPYAPIVDALADHIGAVADDAWPDGLELLLPELVAATSVSRGGQERRLAFQAVTRFLTALAGSGRVLLALDDLQWAGPDTADLLAHLVRHASNQVRVAITYRPGELAATDRLAACLADLARLDEVRRLGVEPLSRAESELLVDAVAAESTVDTMRRGRILRRAGGLPLFLVELTRAALGRSGEEVPGHLRMAVAQQVATLPAHALALLRRMAAMGTVVAMDRLAEWGEPLERVVASLETIRRHGLLDETRHGYRFRYPLVHEMLVLDLGRHERRLWGSDNLAATG